MLLSTTAEFVGRCVPDYQEPTQGKRLTRISFDRALLIIADFLSEAGIQQENGLMEEATAFLIQAELFALVVGNAELIQLVQVWRREHGYALV
jgi:hypothetical protein